MADRNEENAKGAKNYFVDRENKSKQDTRGRVRGIPGGVREGYSHDGRGRDVHVARSVQDEAFEVRAGYMGRKLYTTSYFPPSSFYQKNHHPTDDSVGHNPDVLRRTHKVPGRPRPGRVQHVHDRLHHRIPG